MIEFHYGPKSDIASIGWRTPDRSRIVRDVLVNHGGSEIHLGFTEQGNLVEIEIQDASHVFAQDVLDAAEPMDERLI